MMSKGLVFALTLLLSHALVRAEEAAAATPPPSRAAETLAALKDAPPKTTSLSASEAEQARAAHADSSATDEHNVSRETVVEHHQVSHDATPKEVASLVRLGQNHFKSGDYDSAVIAYLQVLAEQATREEINQALLGLARTYRKKGEFTKAAASYERFAKDFPADPQLPSAYLELGRTFRALGAYKQAIAQFYSVLNSTLKLPDSNDETDYKQLARTAQFEIAETYFQTGNYTEASRFFSRLKLLDLAPEDRARAQFKAAYSLYLALDDENAVSALQAFVTQNEADENVPEARYLLSASLRRLNRNQESLRATLDLLKMETTRTKKDAARWAYWQRKTGNQLANEFYQTGDFTAALTIYESLSALSQDPAWNLPVTYQVGLCNERLRLFDRARAAYQSILDRLKTIPPETAARSDLNDLGEMATWRLSQLNWQATTDAQITALFPSESHQLEKKPTASAHELHGSPAIASDSVR